MGSFKANGREQGPNRRRNSKPARRREFLNLESLESRQLLDSGGGSTFVPLWKPTSTDIRDARNGPMANMGSNLISVYQTLQQTGSAAQVAAKFPAFQFKNDKILVGLTAYKEFDQFQASLRNLGMEVMSANPTYGLVEGWLPIGQLPTAAQLPQTLSGSPRIRPFVEFQGAADNQAANSMFAPQAISTFGANGSGVTVGVISDSVNQAGGGLAASYATGDLPNNGVQILTRNGAVQDGPTGSSDEGRAMLENIYDIAPGAGLAFATGFVGTLQDFADNIRGLASTLGAKVIVDDLTVAEDPFFQDGIIAQAINDVTAQGVSYFSSAGNRRDSGYLSDFRPASGTVGGRTGTWMNFNPNGSALLLPITTNVANATIVFQFDQPFKTQQPASSTAAPTSNLDFLVLDSNGNIVTTVTGGTDDNVATAQPWEFITIPTAGSYSIAIQLVSGNAPNHVQFVGATQGQTSLVVPKTYGTAGNTFYVNTKGHNAAQNTIGTAAVPWWAPAPYLGQSPLIAEPFSNFGPTYKIFNVDGTPANGGSPIVIQNPTITAPDGGNTSFFSGTPINTSSPPFPGQPATATNLSQNLPSFFGTSSAAPNAAAVAALMISKVPTLTPAQVRQGLIASAAASPMNGRAPGAWTRRAATG
ncbi:MAG: S8 family serine peptidase [Isosphaeraceae bacterium]